MSFTTSLFTLVKRGLQPLETEGELGVFDAHLVQERRRRSNCGREPGAWESVSGVGVAAGRERVGIGSVPRSDAVFKEKSGRRRVWRYFFSLRSGIV